ncbi:DegQ family serine endoprotease [Thermomonas haemolytica]|uniref:Probable periplasmic serine endoprotease DegP-like n=1 Tax=Thermomonas haemolytica TaxID=141949 RepID=A0A4R3MXE0_9GAMM|nr:DegQ family serine endoprotease [Thermomonas haemolytica]TCT20985.1 serine protease Do [Thermomonas haemolytica]
MSAKRLIRLRPALLVAALAVAGVGACSGQNTASAQTPVASAPSAPAPDLVGNLPDFTRLVEETGPAVVSVQAEIGGKPQARRLQQMPQDGDDDGGDDQIPEFFRRFFGPGLTPMPGMPGMPGNPGMRPRGVSLGTGFIISSDGYVLTNHHVIDGADKVTVKLSDRREFTAKVVGSDPQSDVALLKIDAKGLPVMRIGDSRTLKPGQWVVAIGSPFGLDHSVTAGIVSAVGRANPGADQRYVPFIQTDVAINRGNSGGPLLNTRGQVVGINSQIFSNSGGYMGVSFAIPIDVAMNAVQQLKATGKVVRGQLGVQVQAMDRDTARALGLAEASGALVAAVEPGSPAERAGLLRQDVIRSVNGQPIYDSSDLPPIIGAMAPGTKVTLEVVRDGKPRTLVATLNALDEATAAAGGMPGGAGKAPARAEGNALGIVGQDLTAEQRQRLGLQGKEGVLIARITGDAARDAGLQPGDVVLAVGRNDVGSAAALDAQLRAAGTDKPVMLLVRRGGGTRYVAVNPKPE